MLFFKLIKAVYTEKIFLVICCKSIKCINVTTIISKICAKKLFKMGMNSQCVDKIINKYIAVFMHESMYESSVVMYKNNTIYITN